MVLMSKRADIVIRYVTHQGAIIFTSHELDRVASFIRAKTGRIVKDANLYLANFSTLLNSVHGD